jgi:hypothetical protein
MIRAWFRRGRQAERLATARKAYAEARWREGEVILPDGTTHQGRTGRSDRCKANRPRGRPRYRDPDADGARSAAAVRDGRPGLGRGGRSSSRALTVWFRVQFLDASGTIIQEMHADAWNAAGAIELVKGIEWPAAAVRMVILDAAGVDVHSVAVS